MTTDHTTPPTTAGRSPAAAAAGPTLAVVLPGAFIALLDTTIVNVALPSMQAGIGAGRAALEWVVAGYALSYGLSLIPGGRLGDNHGHRTTYLTGLALFAAASLAAGLAWSPTVLVTARVVQGLAAGLFFPAIAGVIQTTFAGRDRGRGFALLGATIGLATALGPLVGGLLVEIAGPEHGWRLVFLVNLPIVAVTLPAAARVLRRGQANRTRRRTDPVGLGLLTAGLLLLLLPLGTPGGLGVVGWVSMGSGLLVLCAAAGWEQRVESRGGEPLISPQLLRHKEFALGCALSLVYFGAFSSLFFTLSLLWQGGLGRGPLSTGLMITPFAIGTMVAASRSDRVAAVLGRRVLLLGTSLLTVGLLGVLAVLQVRQDAVDAWWLLLPLLVAGVGNGLFIAPNANIVHGAAPRSAAGTAGGVLNTGQRIGSAIGIAAAGMALFAGPIPAGARAYTVAAEHALLVNLGFLAVALVLVLVPVGGSTGRAAERTDQRTDEPAAPGSRT